MARLVSTGFEEPSFLQVMLDESVKPKLLPEDPLAQEAPAWLKSWNPGQAPKAAPEKLRGVAHFLVTLTEERTGEERQFRVVSAREDASTGLFHLALVPIDLVLEPLPPAEPSGRRYALEE